MDTAPAIGDVVQLNSGGVKMTVTRVQGSDITCKFFDGQGEADEITVPSGAIQKVAERRAKLKKATAAK